MAAKNIGEALLRVLQKPASSFGVQENLLRAFKKELRDTFAHQAMIFIDATKIKSASEDQGKAIIDETIEEAVEMAVNSFVKYMFSDTPAVAEADCTCGHARLQHIYGDGACRPGYECAFRCENFEPKKT